MEKMIVSPTSPYTHDQLIRDIRSLCAAYPGLVSSEDAGYSVEGRALPLIRLGTGPASLLCCGAHHAREYITSAYLMYMVNAYARAAAANRRLGGFDIAKLLRDCSLFVMPMVNPDGVALAQGGLKAVQHPERVKEMMLVRSSYCEWKANVNGIDLNRHYPALWDKRYMPVDKPASELFSGSEPGTEPEVRAVMDVCRCRAFCAALSFHAKGETIGYADVATAEKTPGSVDLARRLAAVSGYALLPVGDNPGIFAASFETWFRDAFHRPALFIRIAPAAGGMMPARERDFFQLVWKKSRLLGAAALDEISGQG
ncbi:MAG: M14 family zinc carboxypeptidase [Christensenellales bacterium]|jgi:g-D-glutamyl-meso-diaminopimelate peptidase